MKHNEAVEILKDTVRFFENAGLHDHAARMSSVSDAISGGTLQGKTTREEILAIKDTTERQKAIAENLELFRGY